MGFIGLMVIFQGQPPDGRGGPAREHALNATRAAFAIRQRALALNDEHRGSLQPIELHMGINTGEALVGATKLGTPGAERWTFTASGPVTNIAARLAGAAAGGEIVVGPATAERIRGHFVLENLGEKTLKHVSEPVRLHRGIPPGVYAKIADRLD